MAISSKLNHNVTRPLGEDEIQGSQWVRETTGNTQTASKVNKVSMVT